MLLFGVFGAVYSSLVSFTHFLAGFFAVAGFAERLQVVEAVRATACDVEDVVNLQVLGVAAFDALVVVALEGGFALFVWCSS